MVNYLEMCSSLLIIMRTNSRINLKCVCLMYVSAAVHLYDVALEVGGTRHFLDVLGLDTAPTVRTGIPAFRFTPHQQRLPMSELHLRLQPTLEDTR